MECIHHSVVPKHVISSYQSIVTLIYKKYSHNKVTLLKAYPSCLKVWREFRESIPHKMLDHIRYIMHLTTLLRSSTTT